MNKLISDDSWYFVAFDTNGDGFNVFNNPSSFFAYGKEELVSVIQSIKEEYGDKVEDHNISIFELKDTQISTEREQVMQTVYLIDFNEAKS